MEAGHRKMAGFFLLPKQKECATTNISGISMVHIDDTNLISFLSSEISCCILS